MKLKRNKDQVILADMHTDGVHFNEQLLARKEEIERQKKYIEASSFQNKQD